MYKTVNQLVENMSEYFNCFAGENSKQETKSQSHREYSLCCTFGYIKTTLLHGTAHKQVKKRTQEEMHAPRATTGCIIHTAGQILTVKETLQ